MSRNNGPSLGGSVPFTPIDPHALSLATEVRHYLPGLAAKSARWSSATTCPQCGGHKARKARVCGVCYREQRAFRIKEESAGRILVRAPVAGPRNGIRQRQMIGVPRDQPAPSRWVKRPDGSWVRG